ncbi:hypothetical protein [Pantoea sp. Cy-640]|jgi:hypothetical protein|uniref:hypothetical protein n=1 Tax=Pantoea sp. Cy-640 TaxID=2608353 RepID=UPI00141A2369|nr:hypothetical protein [Pantoea sp. Cy-640]NIG16332.1 hypothetical protein [Pantoea sp. Cy-640]
MYRNKSEKIMDIAIGEAVAGLLSENAPVSGATLAVRLMEMAASETRPERAEALRMALDEVNAALPATRLLLNPELLFLTEDRPPPGTRQH